MEEEDTLLVVSSTARVFMMSRMFQSFFFPFLDACD